MLTDQFIDSGEGRVRVSSGKANGPPLLFLHGLSRCGRDFATFTPSVASKWQLHSLDFRGHGRSARVPGKYHVADYVRDAVAVVRTLATEPVVVFGHSLGALVAAAVAATEPEGVRAVVLEDPPGASYLARFRDTPNFAQFKAQQPLAGAAHPVSEIARALAAIELPQPDGRIAKLGDLRDPTRTPRPTPPRNSPSPRKPPPTRPPTPPRLRRRRSPRSPSSSRKPRPRTPRPPPRPPRRPSPKPTASSRKPPRSTPRSRRPPPTPPSTPKSR